jgi:hypothetical protein
MNPRVPRSNPVSTSHGTPAPAETFTAASGTVLAAGDAENSFTPRGARREKKSHRDQRNRHDRTIFLAP